MAVSSSCRLRHVHPNGSPVRPSHVPHVRSPAKGKFLRKLVCFPGNQTTRPSPLPRDERRPMEKLSQGLAKARQLRQMPNLYGKRELLVSRRTRAFRLIFCSVRLYNIIGSEPGIFLQKNSRSSPKLSPHNSLVGCSPKRASEIEPCNLIISPSACFVGLGWFMWLSASPRMRFCSFRDPPSVFSRLFPMLPTHSSP